MADMTISERIKQNRIAIFVNLIFALVTFITSLLFWHQVSLLLEKRIADVVTFDLWEVLILLLGFALLLAVFVLVATLHTKVGIQLVLHVTAILPMFLLPFTLVTNIILAFVIYISLVVVNAIIQLDIDLHTRLAISHIFAPRLKLLITVFSVVLAIMFFVASHRTITQGTVTVPSEYIDQLFELSEPFVREQLKNQQEVLLSSFLTQLDEQVPFLATVSNQDKIDLLYGKLTPEVQSAFEAQGYSQAQIDSLVAQIQLEVPNSSELTDQASNESDDFVSAVFGEAQSQVQQVLNEFVDQNKQTIPWILSVSVFFTFSALGLLVKFVAILLARLLLNVLVLLKVVEKTTEQVTAEKYAIPIFQERANSK